MLILQQILIMLATLAVLIAFHEYGHFWVARKCGIKVLRFSIGFGTPLIRWSDKLKTEYVISILPLGGYVKMLDEREAEVSDDEKHLAFNNKTVAQRIAVVSAGPIANLLLALVIYWLVFLQGTVGLAPVIFSVSENSIAAESGLVTGQEIITVDGVNTPTVGHVAMQFIKRLGDSGHIQITSQYQGSNIVQSYKLPIVNWLGDQVEQVDTFADLGIGFYQPKIEPVISEVVTGLAGEKAGMLKGDKILSVDGIPINDWQQWVEYVHTKANIPFEMVVLRNGEHKLLLVTPNEVVDQGRKIGQVGVRPELPDIPENLLKKEEFNLISAWVPAVERTGQMALFSLHSLKKMLFGEISYKHLSGPISIAKVANESAQSGILSYLSLLALLSISLGVLNLLPIPVLDGGHIFFYIIEWIKGSPVSEKIQLVAYQFGMVTVLSIMLLAVVNDIGRL